MDDLQHAKNLKKRLARLRKEKGGSPDTQSYFTPSFSWGLRLGLGWTAQALGGLGLGYGLDTLFNTKPWGLMLGLISGTIVGSVSVYNALKK